MVLSEGVCVGQLAGNPFRMHIDAIGAQSNAKWALLYVPALRLWGFGEPKRSLNRLPAACSLGMTAPAMLAVVRVPQ